MSRLARICFCCALFAVPTTLGAQPPAQPPATQPPVSPVDTVPPAAPTPPPPPPAPEAPRSLFEPTWHQFNLGGRFTNEAGDPARWQRYQDFEEGLLFTDGRWAHHGPGDAWLFRATADNLGYLDQRYWASYERTGRFAITGLWDQVPQFYSVDTKTPYQTSLSPLLLDDATQRAIQNGQATLSAYVPIAPQFKLRERRDVGAVNLVATPTPQVDVRASYTTTRHRGELPWGASFGFGNDVEVALPYDSRTNDLAVSSEWMKGRSMLRVGYNGSWFNNLDDTLVWDSPLRLDDSTAAPGRGRTALWPTNSAQTVSAAGYTKFAHRTQLTGFVSYGFWNNDQPLLPFTINSALPQLTLPRATADAEAHVFSANVGVVSRPADDWQFSARLRRYDYNNRTPQAAIPQFINYDTSLATSSTGGPELFAHYRNTVDADATWTARGPLSLALTAGYTRNDNGYNFRIFDSAAENVLRLSADAVGSQSVSFHAKYEYGKRVGSGLDENLLVEIGEQPDLRHYDLANRTRNQFTGIVDYVPSDRWTLSASGGVGDDDYPDSYFGLREATFRTLSFGVDYHEPNGLSAGVTYNFERYFGSQRGRSASPGQENDPLRDFTTDSAERVHYFSIYAAPPRFGNTEARVYYDFSRADGNYLYTVVAGGPLPPPSQLPDVFNKLQQLHVDVRHRLSTRVAATFSYYYEPFRVFDFAFDQSVVNSIVQPSSLVLGYIYRPYTMHSAVAGLRYAF